MDFPNKQMSRAAAIARYGPIDFSTCHWANQSYWIQMLEIPAGSLPNCKVLNSEMPLIHIACNIDIHIPLLAAIKSLNEIGMADKILTFDGCFNIRMVRGSNSAFSAHSYGLAIDLNAAMNKLGQTQSEFKVISEVDQTMAKIDGCFYDYPEIVKCFTDEGFDFGGEFHDRKDPMHWSYCWE